MFLPTSPVPPTGTISMPEGNCDCIVSSFRLNFKLLCIYAFRRKFINCHAPQNVKVGLEAFGKQRVFDNNRHRCFVLERDCHAALGVRGDNVEGNRSNGVDSKCKLRHLVLPSNHLHLKQLRGYLREPKSLNRAYWFLRGNEAGRCADRKRG